MLKAFKKTCKWFLSKVIIPFIGSIIVTLDEIMKGPYKKEPNNV